MKLFMESRLDLKLDVPNSSQHRNTLRINAAEDDILRDSDDDDDHEWFDSNELIDCPTEDSIEVSEEDIVVALANMRVQPGGRLGTRAHSRQKKA